MFVVLDLETTGADFRADDQGGSRFYVAEVAAITLAADGTETGRWGTVVRVPLADRAGRLTDVGTRFHGIGWDEIGAGIPWADAADTLRRLTTDAVVVGHNVGRFDLPFLVAAMGRVGETLSIADWYDTLVVDRRLRPEGRHNLSAACAAYGIPLVGAHRAMADAEATAELFRAQRG